MWLKSPPPRKMSLTMVSVGARKVQYCSDSVPTPAPPSDLSDWLTAGSLACHLIGQWLEWWTGLGSLSQSSLSDLWSRSPKWRMEMPTGHWELGMQKKCWLMVLLRCLHFDVYRAVEGREWNGICKWHWISYSTSRNSLMSNYLTLETELQRKDFS